MSNRPYDSMLRMIASSSDVKSLDRPNSINLYSSVRGGSKEAAGEEWERRNFSNPQSADLGFLFFLATYLSLERRTIQNAFNCR